MIEIVEEPIGRLREHARIRAAYEGKDYDAIEDPNRWAQTCDLSNWGFLAAYERCGCMLVRATPGAYPTLPPETQLIWEKRL